jgi:hypothetical protein
MQIGAKGIVRCQVLRADGTVKLDTGEFPNLLLDGFFDRWGKNNNITVGANGIKCTTGTGVTLPVPNQTSLEAVKSALRSSTALISSSELTYNASENNAKAHAQWRFAHNIGEVVGNIAELGFSISGAAAQNALDSRVLIKDAGGNPTTITVLSDEQLVVDYRLEFVMSIPSDGVNSTVEISGITYNVNSRITGNNSYRTLSELYRGIFNLTGSSWFGYSSNNVPHANGASPSFSATELSAVSSSKPNLFTLNQSGTIGSSDANYPGGIGSVNLSLAFGNHFSLFFTPKIPKTNLQTLTLTFAWSLTRA